MDIGKLRIGMLVQCPADRGEHAYQGKVESFGQYMHLQSSGSAYVWVTVRRRDGAKTAHVWPSNRISAIN